MFLERSLVLNVLSFGLKKDKVFSKDRKKIELNKGPQSSKRLPFFFTHSYNKQSPGSLGIPECIFQLASRESNLYE